MLDSYGKSYSDSKAKGIVNFIIAAQVILSFFVGVYSFVKIPIQIVKLIKLVKAPKRVPTESPNHSTNREHKGFIDQ